MQLILQKNKTRCQVHLSQEQNKAKWGILRKIFYVAVNLYNLKSIQKYMNG